MTEEQFEELIERAIAKAFRDIGFHQDDVFEVRKDLTFLREWRQTCEEVRHKGMFTVISLLVTGVIGLLILGFRGWLH